MFSRLEKDQKTLDIVYKYLGFFLDRETSRTLFDFDNHLQINEIQHHLISNGFSLDDDKEKLIWINLYGKNYRNYLNACYILATLIEGRLLDHIVNLEDINNEYIFHIIEIYDDRLQPLLDQRVHN